MTTTDQVVEFDQGRAVGRLTRHLSLLLAGLLLGLVAAGALIALRGRTFTATSQVVVAQPANLQDLLTVTQSTRTASSTVVRDSQLRRLEDERISDAVAAQLADRPDYAVRFDSSTTSNVVGIVATSKSASTARDAANAYGQLYVQGINKDEDDLIAATESQIQGTVDQLTTQIATLEQTLINATTTSLPQVQAIVGPSREQLLERRGVLERQLDQLRIAKSADLSGARVASPAEVQRSSIAGLLVIGGLLGLLLGVAAAALREKTRGRVYDEQDVLASGLTPRVVADVAVRTPRAVVAEQDDRLSDADRSRLRQLAATMWPPHATPLRHQVCLVAPVDDQAGAGAVLVARLARQLEVLGHRVAVVEGDARRGHVAAAFGTAGAPGVAEVVRGELGLDDVLRTQRGGRLVVVPAGSGASAEDVYSAGFAALLRGLDEVADVVLVVGAPLTEAAEAFVVAPLVDRLVVLVARGRSRRRALETVRQSLAEQGSPAATLRHPDVLLHRLTGRGRRAGRGSGTPAAAPVVAPEQGRRPVGSSRVESALVTEDARLRVSD